QADDIVLDEIARGVADDHAVLLVAADIVGHGATTRPADDVAGRPGAIDADTAEVGLIGGNLALPVHPDEGGLNAVARAGDVDRRAKEGLDAAVGEAIEAQALHQAVVARKLQADGTAVTVDLDLRQAVEGQAGLDLHIIGD